MGGETKTNQLFSNYNSHSFPNEGVFAFWTLIFDDRVDWGVGDGASEAGDLSEPGV